MNGQAQGLSHETGLPFAAGNWGCRGKTLEIEAALRKFTNRLRILSRHRQIWIQFAITRVPAGNSLYLAHDGVAVTAIPSNLTHAQTTCCKLPSHQSRCHPICLPWPPSSGHSCRPLSVDLALSLLLFDRTCALLWR